MRGIDSCDLDVEPSLFSHRHAMRQRDMRLRLTCCLGVPDLLSWSLSRVHLYRLCSSSEQGTNVSDTHNTRTNYFTYLEQESVILL